MKTRFFPITLLTLGITGALVSKGLTAEANSQGPLTSAQTAFFEKNIRPAFIKYCYECHSEESGKTRGGLLVDTREGLAQGGDSGPAINFQNPANSVLLRAITHQDRELTMPPKEKMPDSEIQNFRIWLNMGAPDPRAREKFIVESRVDIEAGKKHWAFQKPTKSSGAGIDSLVSAKLASAGLSKAEPADPATLLRRVTFDLSGLPPTPDEVASFLKAWDNNPDDALEAKVDELLSYPHFGERWGRHWMDVARYAESSGKDANFTFPHAWRYRDYVIDAFNADKPYDEFIQEQIAGDLLPAKSQEEQQEHMIATGFLAMGTKGLNERNPRVFQMDLVDEQIDTMSQAILGVTIACARCHDHKFDPIPTTDYYALAGIFLSTDTLYGTVAGLQNHRPTDLLTLPGLDKRQIGRSYSPQEIQDMEAQIRETRANMRSERMAAQRAGKQVEQRKMVAGRNQIGRLEGILDSLDERGAPKTVAMGVKDLRLAQNARVLVRGDVEKPAQEVERGFLQVLDHSSAAKIRPNSSGRLELAQWLTSKDNPLTARVMANRIWMHLLGEPLVSTPNNWGLSGQKPSHPQLLDYLAIRLMDEDWSMKSLIREIALSETYRRSSRFNARNYAKDPDNIYLWRANPRPLDAEALRDSMLAVSGAIDLERPLGSEIATVGDARFGRQVSKDSIGRGKVHRSVYLATPRDGVTEALALFDFADPNATNAKRDVTIVPSQALYLMNSSFVTGQADAMALKLIQKLDDHDQRIQTAFLKAYGRPATKDELTASAQFFREFKPEPPPASASNPQRGFRGKGFRGKGQGRRRPTAAAATPVAIPMERQALTLFCQGLMASAEFRILN